MRSTTPTPPSARDRVISVVAVVFSLCFLGVGLASYVYPALSPFFVVSSTVGALFLGFLSVFPRFTLRIPVLHFRLLAKWLLIPVCLLSLFLNAFLFVSLRTVTSAVTPTPTALTSTATPAVPPTLSDPLQDNSRGLQWQEVTHSDASCSFVLGKHYLLTASANQYVPCKTQAPQSNLGNFVYQITMIIRSGLANTGSRASPLGAGPQFRIESSQNNPHYGLLFNTLGNWSFYVVVNNNGSPLLTPLGGVRCGDPCPHFKTGYNQPNVFTIWAVGSQLDVWLNGYLIDSTSDPAVPSGFLGVRLNGGNSSSSVEFRDLRVWQQ